MAKARRATVQAAVRAGHIACVLLVCNATSAQDVDIHICAAKGSILVGEPAVLVVTIRSDAELRVDPTLQWASAGLKILIDDGGGFRRHLEKQWFSDWNESDKAALDDGEATFEVVLCYDASSEKWPFGAVGSYQVVAEYQDGSIGPFRSNTVTIDAVAPTGADATVLEALRGAPSELGVHGPNRMGTLVQELVSEHPSSVYLQLPLLNDLEARLSRIYNGYDPSLPPAVGTDENPPPGPNLAPETIRARVTALIPDAELAAEIGGALQPDALFLLAGLYSDAGDIAAAGATFRRVAEGFPGRVAARAAEGELAE